MTFTITFYKMTCEKNRVDKTNYISNYVQYDECLLKENTSLINPSVNIRLRTSQMTQIFEYNYCYIDSFKRYYFVKNISTLYNGMFSIDLELDVLMTYKEQIKSNTAIVARNEFDYNSYVVDNKIAYKKNPIIEQYDLSNDLFYAPVEYVEGQPRDDDNEIYKIVLSVFGGDYTSVNQG